MKGRSLVLRGLLAAVCLVVFAELIREVYKDHGDGDQLGVWLVIFFSFTSPVLTPVMHFKMLLLHDVLPAWVETEVVRRLGRFLFTPSGKFEDYDAGNLTNYSDPNMWSMFPGRGDTSEAIPNGLESCHDVGICDGASLFYLFPTTWYTGASWNAPAYHPVTNYLTDGAIGPQQATAFNIIGNAVYAPRFRQMSAGAFMQEDGFKNDNSKKALAIAYEDVREAFKHFLKVRKTSGIIIAGHSQGSLLGELLLKEFLVDKPLRNELVAAYLPGWTVFESSFEKEPQKTGIHVCDGPKDLHCVISWRTFGRGGDPKAFLHVEPENEHDKPVCVNPLSWRKDGALVDRAENHGGLDLMHPWSMFRYLIGETRPKERTVLPEITANVADAECQHGHLFTETPKRTGYGWGLWPAWLFASFPGLNLHPYDYNLYFVNVRRNVAERVEAFMIQKA